jgi:hypothetical protein
MVVAGPRSRDVGVSMLRRGHKSALLSSSIQAKPLNMICGSPSNRQLHSGGLGGPHDGRAA